MHPPLVQLQPEQFALSTAEYAEYGADASKNSKKIINWRNFRQELPKNIYRKYAEKIQCRHEDDTSQAAS